MIGLRSGKDEKMYLRQGVAEGVLVALFGLGAALTVFNAPRPNQDWSIVRFLKRKGGIPANAPAECPGLQSEKAGKDDACAGCPNRSICASGQPGQAAQQTKSLVAEISDKLQQVKHKILVLSGKGGVGKSTVATQLAWELQSRGLLVGLMDIDICGPSIPRMTGTRGAEVRAFGGGWLPVCVNENLCVMSTEYLLPDRDDAVIWRGPKKNGLIRQFLSDVYWGDLDFLIIDTPPGTSDEHLSIVSWLQQAGVDGAVVVTTPQEVSLQDVRKEINFCKKTGVKVLGVVENMAGSVFTTSVGAAERMCTAMEVPYAGQVTMTAAVVQACEDGVQVPPDCPARQDFQSIVNGCLLPLTENDKENQN